LRYDIATVLPGYNYNLAKGYPEVHHDFTNKVLLELRHHDFGKVMPDGTTNSPKSCRDCATIMP
jgi:hypothetical protein